MCIRDRSRSSAVAVTLIIRAQTLWFAVLLGVLALLIFSRRRHVAVSLDQVTASNSAAK